jgi:hypothetical protein
LGKHEPNNLAGGGADLFRHFAGPANQLAIDADAKNFRHVTLVPQLSLKVKRFCFFGSEAENLISKKRNCECAPTLPHPIN